MNRIELNLRAGAKYLTVRVDNGEAGPVLTLHKYTLTGGASKLIPFLAGKKGSGWDYYVAYTGRCESTLNDDPIPSLQITGEYREPTIAERWQKWREDYCPAGELAVAEFEKLVEAVRKLEGSKS